MLVTMMRAKLHRATITRADLDYEGSISVDADLLERADILPNEQVDVLNITNGARFTTYAIEAERGSREVQVNGAAARLVQPGDRVIVVAYGQLPREEARNFAPTVVLLEDDNRVKRAALTPVAGGPSVLFVCDAGPRVGGGHVMRSLTLAQALSKRGARCAFLADPFTEALLDRYDRTNSARVTVADHRPGTLIAATAPMRFDAVVIDHFEWGARHDRALQAVASVRMAVDDQTSHARDVDLWVDCNLGRVEADLWCMGERPTTPTWLLLGPDYAPVRPEFADARASSLSRREGAAVRRVLVSLGLTDLDAITARVVKALRPVLDAVAVDIVLGKHAPSRRAVKRMMDLDPRLTLHTDVADMAALMASADLCIGAGGSSTWERACLGLPTVTVVLAPNQEPGTRALADAGAAVRLDASDPDFEGQLSRAFTNLRNDADARAELSRRAAALCDGQGADRTAAAILNACASRPADSRRTRSTLGARRPRFSRPRS